jgi:hypothetical protein
MFQKNGKQSMTPSTVIFVPSTRGGLLVKKLKENEEEMSNLTGFKVKFQEAGEAKLINSFEKDLGKGRHCGRKPCPPCDMARENRHNCRSRNLIYESCCQTCNPSSLQVEKSRNTQPRIGVYVGETSRSLHERAVEHANDAKDFNPKSHIVKHWMLSHPEMNSPPKMTFKATSMFKDCLSRQIGEALRIHHSKDTLLNSKSEYLTNCITRITVEEDAWERRENSRREEEAQRMEKIEVERFKMQKLKFSSKLSSQQVDPPSLVEKEVCGQVTSVNMLPEPPSLDDDEQPVREQSPRTINESGHCPLTSINMLTTASSQPDTDDTPLEMEKIMEKGPSQKNTKPKTKTRQCKGGYNLGYFGLWWSRMEREAKKECLENIRIIEDMKGSTRLRKMLIKNRPNVPTIKKSDNEINNARVSSKVNDVLHERHLGSLITMQQRALEWDSTLHGGRGV